MRTLVLTILLLSASTASAYVPAGCIGGDLSDPRACGYLWSD